jgi:hypothetical protein
MRPMDAFVALVLAGVSCTSQPPFPEPTATQSREPAAFKGIGIVTDAEKDVKATRGSRVDRSVDVRRVELNANGKALLILVRFAGPVPAATGTDSLHCKITLDTEQRRLFYIVDLLRGDGSGGGGGSWGLRGALGANQEPELYPVHISGSDMIAHVPLEFLSGLPPTFLWRASCDLNSRNNAAVSTDEVGTGESTFRGTA